ncbi:MAG: hypothetical protein P4M00_07330 [Azospirillaceae bacterium]|nr:hypothetical protein [Azospirillaceae bacterium]
MDRRQILQGVGVAAAIGTGLAARPANAFQFLPQSDFAVALSKACGGTAEHTRMLAEAATALGVQPGDPAAEKLLGQLKCPICGCPLMSVASALY